MPNITNRCCTTPVKKRERLHDAECKNLYVSLSPSELPTFFLRYSCKIRKKRLTQRLGVYQQAGEGIEARDVAYWRKEAMKLKIRIANGEDIAQAARQAHELQAKLTGTTVDDLIDLRIAWISEVIEVRRHTEEGVIIKRKPRMKDHVNMAAHLNRFVRPRLGPKVACEVTKYDIATLQADILAGKFVIRKRKADAGPPISSARHMRKAVSGLFSWAAEVGRDYVSSSPCVNLPPLPDEEPRLRKLSPAEIRTLWHGLDSDDLPFDRRICLALKFALVSMLRSVELLHIHRSELGPDGLNSALPLVVIPEERVKAGREIHQPLSDLAVEIAKEAMGNYQWLFAGRWDNAPLARGAMAAALRGRKVKVKGKIVVKQIGICELLGLRAFTPHDLRRTAASLMGGLKVPRSIIALCLDHTIKADEHGLVAAVTGKHYDQDPRIAEKREALQKLADEIRRITDATAETELRLVA
jgi:integrase